MPELVLQPRAPPPSGLGQVASLAVVSCARWPTLAAPRSVCTRAGGCSTSPFSWRQAWPRKRKLDLGRSAASTVNDKNYRSAVLAELSVVAVKNELERCVGDGALPEAYGELAEDLWHVRDELKAWMECIPSAVSQRQPRIVLPPFVAKCGVPLIREAAMRARANMVTLRPYADESMTTCIEVMQDIMQISA